MITAAVAGASGYAGGELLRLLAGHPDFVVGPVAAGGKAGQRLSQVHPQLISLGDRVFDPTTPAVLGTAEVVFLALPHGESAALVAQLPGTCKVVDLGADFRLRDGAQWEQFYGLPHAGAWVYGLPELPGVREQIMGASRVANPGCFPTAVALALSPLLVDGLIECDDIVVTATSGTSGAGRKAAEHLMASEVMGSMSAYKVGGGHQHTPEMEQSLSDSAGRSVRLSFTPMLAPMPRGILASCSATAVAGAAAGVRESLVSAYENEPFVHVLPPGQWPQTASVFGTNAVHLQVAFDEHSNRVIVISAIDNLGKGAAGQALQNANIMLGLPETLGLTSDGVAP
ncbi:MAG: N-acetyl-gamma-glutamyl-phosphate reductase [Candidatus Nanopelagicales bacterium]|nr:N-acetyl-gamma-glutamyl-phosphate reductase [Candidatus Nanopelagicales bacterium]